MLPGASGGREGRKGASVAAGTPFPRIHDLAELNGLLSPEAQMRLDRRNLEALDPWAIGGRYADDLVEADEATAAELRAAERNMLGRERPT